MPFTQAQEAAIHADNRELLVTAAAGSGKTRVLIERIFRMLKDDGLSMDRLLIVTFTHAAAAEMRERLQARIAQEAAQDSRMRRQAELLETAQISTLHSFCQKIVKEYFQEAGIDPLSTLGEETVCAALREQAKAEALDACYAHAATGDFPASALTAKLEEKQIERMMDALYPFLMALPDPFDWLGAQANQVYTEDALQGGALAETLLADCGLLAMGMGELMAACERLLDQPLLHARYAASIKGDRQAVDAVLAAAAKGLMPLTAQAAAFKLEKLPTVRGLEGEEAALRDAYKGYRDQLKKQAASIATRIPGDGAQAIARLNAMQPALQGLHMLIQEMDAAYAASKRERNLLDFHDLERMALQILRNPEIGAEVALRYDGVFVDEYQDISGVQEAILNAIKRDVSRETSLPPQRYFYVGDVKQSIYRFRQADPTLFMQKARDFADEETAPQRRISLNANFRSREAVLSGVNRVFERVMRADVTEIDYDAQARLVPGTPSHGDVPVSLHLFTQPIRAADRYKLQAYAIAREIRRRVGAPQRDRDGHATDPLHYRDFAILAPKMKSVSTVLERVMQEMGIPVYCEDRASALESEEISQAVNHLRLLDNIADDLSLLAWLRSPAGGFGERELAQVRLRKPEGSYLEALRAAAEGTDLLAALCKSALTTLARERFLLMETPLDAYLWGWLSRSGLYAFFGCQPNGKLRQANLRMLCDKAGEHMKRRGGDLHSFLSSVESRTGIRDSASPTVLSPWEDVVRVMTIHKSKGLEFPVVFVMGLEETFGARRGGGAIAHPRLGVALPYVNEQARTTGETLLKSAIQLRAQAEERAERARLLYVAMTRAREELILMGCDARLSPADAADGFAARQGDTAYAVYRAACMLDWVTGCLTQEDHYYDAAAAGEDAPPANAAASDLAREDASHASAPAAHPPHEDASHASASDQPAEQISACESIINNDQRKTISEAALSTQSTFNPQKTGVWDVVFHNDPEEVKLAQRHARGKGGLSALAERRARLAALAEDARMLAQRQGYALPLDAMELETPAADEPTPDALASDMLPSDSLAMKTPAPDVLIPDTLPPDSLTTKTPAPDVLTPDTLPPDSLATDTPAPDALTRNAQPPDALTPQAAATPHASAAANKDPLAPPTVFDHHPYKVGATALVRAHQQALAASLGALLLADDDSAALESIEHKRLPLPMTRPRLMADLPAVPAFLRDAQAQTGVRRGVATHKALSLLDYAPLRAVAADGSALHSAVAQQLAQMLARRLLTPEEAPLVEATVIARFLESRWGRAALAADVVYREWCFNLRMPEQGGVIVQGVIDLCFLLDGAWMLVDYKTDRVDSAQSLWTLYGEQMALYRRALAEATPWPVREVTLFSLALGEGSAQAFDV